ncbi:MAG: helix-turn-helix domain-containing protein [Thermoleophilia bacterium]|nr:helix-turn-helix domain-containing protein [Thermoleophilia bacterium]
MTGRKSERRSRREATTSAMLDAAERLFSEQGFTAVSVRDIADAAGVSHALVHRYLGSKEEIYRAVLQRNEDVMLAAAGATGDLDEALALMYREGLAHHRDYLRLIAHSALHGLPYESTIGRFPATERLIELAEERASRAGAPPDVPPRVVIAAVVSLYLGWASMDAWMHQVAGLDALDDETVAAGVERVILTIADSLVPGGDG